VMDDRQVTKFLNRVEEDFFNMTFSLFCGCQKKSWKDILFSLFVELSGGGFEMEFCEIPKGS